MFKTNLWTSDSHRHATLNMIRMKRDVPEKSGIHINNIDAPGKKKKNDDVLHLTIDTPEKRSGGGGVHLVDTNAVMTEKSRS